MNSRGRGKCHTRNQFYWLILLQSFYAKKEPKGKKGTKKCQIDLTYPKLKTNSVLFVFWREEIRNESFELCSRANYRFQC